MGKSESKERPERDKGKDRCPEYSLDELLKGVTEENIHREVMTGPPVGKEI